MKSYQVKVSMYVDVNAKNKEQAEEKAILTSLYNQSLDEDKVYDIHTKIISESKYIKEEEWWVAWILMNPFPVMI